MTNTITQLVPDYLIMIPDYLIMQYFFFTNKKKKIAFEYFKNKIIIKLICKNDKEKEKL